MNDKEDSASFDVMVLYSRSHNYFIDDEAIIWADDEIKRLRAEVERLNNVILENKP